MDMLTAQFSILEDGNYKKEFDIILLVLSVADIPIKLLLKV